MRERMDVIQDENITPLGAEDFLAVYNNTTPEGFPSASLALLEEFRHTYPSLFSKREEAWTIDRHRKRLMDWLAVQNARA